MAQNRHPLREISSSGRLGHPQSVNQKTPSQQHRWATRLATKEQPTEKFMANRGTCTTPSCTINCGHLSGYFTHIFQCQKGD